MIIFNSESKLILWRLLNPDRAAATACADRFQWSDWRRVR